MGYWIKCHIMSKGTNPLPTFLSNWSYLEFYGLGIHANVGGRSC